MKILLLKLSSIGDLIHVFPALTELQKADPKLELTWVVESAFQEVPLWHPTVKHVIAAPFRQIKKEGFSLQAARSLWRLAQNIRREKYDFVIDAQGLFKSAWLAKIARGPSIGFGKKSGREAVWWLYNKRVTASWDWHAIARIETLFQAVLPSTKPEFDPHVDYALKPWQPVTEKVLMFVHGTTWESKHYPDALWLDLVKLATAAGYQVWLPHSNERELKRAAFLSINDQVKILPKMSLTALKNCLYDVAGVIAVDTGLAHISAALGVPTVTLYGPTEPSKIGTLGRNQVHLTTALCCFSQGVKQCAHLPHDKKQAFECFEVLRPVDVFNELMRLSVGEI